MSDGALEAALYASRRSKRGHRRVAEPDWASVHRDSRHMAFAPFLLLGRWAQCRTRQARPATIDLLLGSRERAIHDIVEVCLGGLSAISFS